MFYVLFEISFAEILLHFYRQGVKGKSEGLSLNKLPPSVNNVANGVVRKTSLSIFY